ncbi:MAG: ribonuclease III [Actinomycetota bacterium]
MAAADESPSDLSQLAASIGHDFADVSLLERALRHRSWCAEHGDVVSNERLEFLGDAVLGWAVADLAFHRFGDEAEGRLTELRKAVVNAAALAEIAEAIGVGPHLLLGKGEASAGGATKPSILSDAFEAILAAVYLDGGVDAAFAMVERHVAPHLASSIDRHDRLDHKTVLQEQCAQAGVGAPDYRVTSVGPDHAKVFTATVLVDGREIGLGTGRSKKAAEQAAAADATSVAADAPAPPTA